MAVGKHHAVQSMSDVGKCYDNARMESFFATLKKENLYGTINDAKAELGSLGEINKIFVGFQKGLYAA